MFLKIPKFCEGESSSGFRPFNVPRTALILLILIGMWRIFLWRAFEGGHSFALFSDNEAFLGPVLSSMSSTMAKGEWPLRMSEILGGIPLYNLAQLSPFYPFYLISLPIYSNPVDTIYSMHWVILAHILIFEINMYIFIRIAGASRVAAIIGAALVAFSANSYSYAVWVNIVAPYSWLPLYLGGLLGILRSPSSISYFIMAVVGIVLLTLASPSQPLIHAVFVTLIFVCSCWCYQWRAGEVRQIPRSLSRVVMMGALALLLVAPVLLPTVLEFKNMIRWIGAFPPVVGSARIPFEAFQTDQLTISDLGGIFFKFSSGAVGGQYLGLPVIALASVAAVSRSKSWIVIALVFIAFYALVSATGTNLGLAYINYHIPLLNKIREPSRFLVLFQLSMGVLAAFGIDELRKTTQCVDFSTRAMWHLGTLILLIIVSVLTFLCLHEFIVSAVSPLMDIAILVILTALVWARGRLNEAIRGPFICLSWGGAALFFLAINVSWAPPSITKSDYLTGDTVALNKVIEKVAILDPSHEYRVIFDGKLDKQRAAMLASYQGVRSFNMYFNPAPRRQFEELYYHGPRLDNYFRVLGAKYIICKECARESVHDYKRIESILGYEIYETSDVLPHSYIVQKINGEFLNLSDFIAKASNKSLSEKILYVHPYDNITLGGGSNGVVDTCIKDEDINSTNRLRFVVHCKFPGVLVLNEFFDEAWKITVDGVKVASLEVNGNQIGVPFAGGSHVIEFRYWPNIFAISLLISFLGGMIMIGICVLAGKRRK